MPKQFSPEQDLHLHSKHTVNVKCKTLLISERIITQINLDPLFNKLYKYDGSPNLKV
jgi:hypothetical protein